MRLRPVRLHLGVKAMMLSVLMATALPFSASASEVPATYRCEKPVLQVIGNKASARTAFTVDCHARDAMVIAPTVTLSGNVLAVRSAPYLIDAQYTVDARSLVDQALGLYNESAQSVSGEIYASVSSLARLPQTFEKHLVWDAQNNLLSIQERTGRWQVFAMNAIALPGEPVLRSAGYASLPVYDGKSMSRLVFGPSVSRFAPPADSYYTPQIDVVIGASAQGGIELLIEPTRRLNAEAINLAIERLDAKSDDMSRAWALGSMAQFMGLYELVRYAETKVAASHPNLLVEFQRDINSIIALVLPVNPLPQ